MSRGIRIEVGPERDEQETPERLSWAGVERLLLRVVLYGLLVLAVLRWYDPQYDDSMYRMICRHAAAVCVAVCVAGLACSARSPSESG